MPRKVTPEYNLEVLYPEVAKEWHLKKNGALKAENVTHGSNKRVWWKCKKNHAWESTINNRVSGYGCPYCAGKRAGKDNNLKKTFPKVASEWHPKKNKDLTPRDVTPGSGKKVWWICKKEHEWESSISDRTDGHGCPYCTGRKVGKDNNLAVLNPKVAKEWHPKKNIDLTPRNVVPGSNKKVWWICKKGHEWDAIIGSRANRARGCPYCSGNRLGKDNNLEYVFPELAMEWHPSKNKTLKPNQISSRNNRKVWWSCKKNKDHVWEATISSRANGVGCPFCKGKRADKENNLLKKYPEIAKEWHTTKNQDLTPKDVAPGSNKKVWWKCENNNSHQWQTTVVSRSNRGRGCPQCYKENKPDITRRGFLKKNGSLAEKYPELLKEWHPTKNLQLTPDQITPKSGQRVWWTCKIYPEHEWECRVADRTLSGSGCPHCNSQTSKLEIRVYCEVKYVFGDVAWRTKINKKECDVYLSNENLGIEIDGYPWHLGNEKRDKAKEKHFKKNGITLFRLRDDRLGKISGRDVFYKNNENELAIIKRLFVAIKKCSSIQEDKRLALKNYLKYSNFKNDEEYKKIISCLPGPLPEKSFATVHPELLKEWSTEKNSPLSPVLFFPKSRYKVWWICKKSVNHVWKAPIGDRTTGHGCPYCSGNKVGKDNNLKFNFPKIAEEWHPTKNEQLKPSQVTSRSGIKIWWLCKSYKTHIWQSTVADRTGNNRGCPFCSGKYPSKENNFQKYFPEIAKEWHPNKNGELTPDKFLPKSGKKMWWLCNHNHEWQMTIGNRAVGQGCPYCAGNYPTKENNLAVLNPKLAKDWHPTKNNRLTPKDVLPNSNKRAWWICKKGHEWDALIYSRVQGNGCPFCAGKRVGKDNNLAVVNPKLANEWHLKKNKDLTPRDVTPGSGKKVWWICKKEHEWDAVISSRFRGTDCPYCAGKRVGKDNNLAVLNPKIAKEWHPVKNGDLTPSLVRPGSHKIVWWLCKKKHEWQTAIKHRKNGSGCPCCSGRTASKENNLQTKFPKIAEEWHPRRNKDLTPKDVTPGSNKKAWWICKKGHEWDALIYSRVQGNGCPFCAGKRVKKVVA
jgi:hypothetical protein